MNRVRYAVLLVLLVAIAFARAANENNASSVVKTADRQLAEKIVRAGGKILVDYGAFLLLDSGASSSDAANVAAESGAESLPDARKIFLNAGAIDTSTKGSAGNAAMGSSGERSLHLIQFVGPIKGEWLSAVTEAGAQVVTYIPENAYLIYATASDLQALHGSNAAASFLQWDGAYLDAYKLHPEAAEQMTAPTPESDAPVYFAIQLFSDEPTNRATRDVIETLRTGPVLRDETVLQYRNIVVALDPRPASTAGIETGRYLDSALCASGAPG
jgi:hypothetical protein